MAEPISTLFIDFRAGTANLAKDLNKIVKNVRGIGRDFQSVGKGLSQTFSAPIIAGAAAALKAADNLQKAQGIIRSQTGKTGTELKKLYDDYQSVIETVPGANEEIAKVFSLLSSTTGAAGDELKDLTTTVVSLANVTGKDMNSIAKSSSQIFEAWGVSAKDLNSTLDFTFRAFQNTGVNVETLLQTVATSDEVFKPLGFSLEQSIALLASFDKAGIDAATVVAGLSTAIRKMSQKDIGDFAAGLQGAFQVLKDSSSADQAKKSILLFGKAAGLDLGAALAEGRFNINEFYETLKKGTDTASAVQKSTTTISQQFELMRERLTKPLADLGDELSKAFKDALDPLVKETAESLTKLVKAFNELDPATKKAIGGWVLFAAALGPVLYYLGTSIIAISAVGKALVGLIRLLPKIPVLGTALSIAFGAVKEVFDFARVAVSDFGFAVEYLYSFVKGPIEAIGSLFSSVFDAIPAALGVVTSVIAGVFGGLVAGAAAAGGDMKLFLSGFVELFWNLVHGIQSAISTAAKWLYETWTSVMEFLGEKLSEFVAYASERLGNLLSAVDEFLQSFGIDVPGIWQSAINLLAEAWNGFVEGFFRSIDSIRKTWQSWLTEFRSGIYGLGKLLNVEAWQKWAVESQKASRTASESVGAAKIEIKKTGEAAVDMGGKVGKAAEGVKKTGEEIKKTGAEGKKTIPGLSKLFEDAGDKVDETTRAIQGLQKSIKELGNNRAVDKIKQGIEEAAKLGKSADFGDSFSKLEEAYAKSYEEGTLEGLKNVTPEQLAEIKKLSKEKAAIEIQSYKDDIVPKQLEADKDRHEKQVQFFQGLMEDAISGTRFNWEDQFKKAATEIAAEWLTRMLEANLFAANSFGEFFSGAFQALGGAVDSWLGNLAGGSLGGILGGGSAPSAPTIVGSATGGGAITGVAGGAAGGAGAGAASGFFSSTGFSFASATSLQSIAGVGGALVNFADALRDWDNGTKGKGAAVGTGLGAAAGAILGGPFGAAIGSAIGRFAGSFIGGLFSEGQNPERIARQKAEQWFEQKLDEGIKSGRPLKIFNADGKLQEFGKNFNRTLIDFTKSNWADDFWKKFGDKGAEQFNALGTALQQVLGLDENVGGQLGALLADQLGTGDFFQNLDNIKLFMDSMGISVKDLTDGLFQMGLAGKISWQQFEAMNQALGQLPEVGLAAVGDINKAFQLLLQSGGRGAEALTALKDVAIEAAEAGANTFDALRQKLLAAGYDVQTVDAFFQALAQRGIKGVKELGEASQETLAGIVADMESAGVKWENFTDATEAMNASVEKLATSIDTLSNAIRGLPDKTIHISSVQDDAAQANKFGNVFGFAGGGVFNSKRFFRFGKGGTSLGMLGEAGPEAILPLRRINGRLGVSALGMGGGGSTYVINIDARGADAGVEHRIELALEAIRETAVRDTLDRMSDDQRREP